MKKIISALLLIPVFATAQTSPTARIEKDTLFFNGAYFIKGQALQLGERSNTSANTFSYIYTAPTSIGPIRYLAGDRSNGQMSIKNFKREGSSKDGYQYYLVVRGGSSTTYWCDVAGALNAKEIKSTEIVRTPAANAKPAVSGSVADELKKWKDLLDAGAITKEEYEKQKAKLLQ